MRRGLRRSRLSVAGVLVAGVLLGSVPSCSNANQVPSIGYAVDAVVASYNGGSALGVSSGAPAVFARVLTGFFYTGPDGQPVADTDTGTAKEVPGEAQTIQYRLNPDGVYSDGVPTSCDDLVLEWAARSGHFTRPGPNGPVPVFDAASTAGYADVERVDCQPGSKDATVVFRPGRRYQPWRMLFNAADLMPAHVAAQAAKVPNVVTVLQSGDAAAVERLADFWNNGWKLAPGPLDPSLLPSSGPYRVESFTDKDGLVLVKNERWWGNQAKTPRIVVWSKTADLAAKIGDNAIGVVDIGAGSVRDLNLAGFSVKAQPSRGAEQLVLATGGVFGSVNARRAFAQCVPRQVLYDKFGHPDHTSTSVLGSGTLNSRTLQQDSVYYPAVTQVAERYGGDGRQGPGASTSQNVTVRIGYVRPDERRAQTVSTIAEACRPVGITVVDAGAPDFMPNQLTEGTIDAVLGSTGAAPGPAGSLSGMVAIGALGTGQGVNFGRFGNGRYDAIADQLAADSNSAAVPGLLTEQENLLWSEMPSIPLFATPRTIAFGQGMENGLANPTEAGAGWNMDRWVLKR